MKSATLLPNISPTLRRAGALTLSLLGFSLGMASSSDAATLLYGYNFNDTGPNAASTNGSPAMNLFNSSSVATDLHGASGSGVSGQASDRALDLSSAASMGNVASSYGLISGITSGLSGLGSFTVTGWYKADENVNNTSARLMTTNNANVFLFFNGGLQLSVDGVNASTGAATDPNLAYQAVGSWVYFAVTYDGTIANFYRGTTSGMTGSVFSQGLAQGALATSSATSIYAGNRATPFDRNFDGLMDDFRFYSGVLDATEVNGVRLEGISNVPEPTGLTLGLACAGGALVLRRRNRR